MNKDFFTVFVGLNPKWFKIDSWYYDGHTSKSVTVLGVEIGKTYSYDAKSLNIKEWAASFQPPQAG